MAETLKKLRVDIKFTATTGYRAEVGFNSHGTVRCPPRDVLLEAGREIARLAALCGWTDDLKAKVEEADSAVRKDLMERKQA
jgi:hypothetical protein